MRLDLTTLIIALAAFAAAAPQSIDVRQPSGMAIPLTKRAHADGKSFNPRAFKSQVASVEAKIHHGLANFERSTGSKHPAALNGTLEQGAVPLKDYNNAIWYGEIWFGEEYPRSFTVSIDTGSTLLIVPTIMCGRSCDDHNHWDPSRSSTARDLGRPFNVTYGSGQVAVGELYTETVTLGGYTAANVIIGGATMYPPMWNISVSPEDGVFGMAFGSISRYGPTFFETLISQKKVPKPEFSISLRSSGAELFLGGSNPEQYTGNFTYTPVVQRGFWEVEIDSIAVNNVSILHSVLAIIDTGTSYVLGPLEQVTKLFSALNGSYFGGGQYWTLPCNTSMNLSFTFGGRAFTIPSSGFILSPTRPGSSMCVSTIGSHSDTISFWVIGDAFLKTVYTTFDVGGSRVGFAELS